MLKYKKESYKKRRNLKKLGNINNFGPKMREIYDFWLKKVNKIYKRVEAQCDAG